MNLLWHMPTLRRHTCGLSIRALRLASLLRDSGNKIAFAVDASKTDIREGSIDGMPMLRLTTRKPRPMHWSLQASARYEAAVDMADRVGLDWDVVISCQPEFVTAYADFSGHPPIVFVCGSTTLHHDIANQAHQTSLGTLRRIPFVIDRTLKRRNERRAFRVADAVVFDSHQTRDLVMRGYGVSPEKCHAIRGGVDEHQFSHPGPDARRAARDRLGIRDGEFTIVWTGRLSPEKNLSLLFRALPLCESLPAHTLIVGEGSELEALNEQCRASGLADVVRFVGGKQDVRPYLHAADLFVFPSRSESLGLAALEAMACGLPIVGLKPDGHLIRNANIELIEDGQCGLLVNGTYSATSATGPDVGLLAGQDVGLAASLAVALDHLRADPDSRRRFGEAGRQWALGNFTWSRAGERFGSLLRDILPRPKHQESQDEKERPAMVAAMKSAM